MEEINTLSSYLGIVSSLMTILGVGGALTWKVFNRSGNRSIKATSQDNIKGKTGLAIFSNVDFKIKRLLAYLVDYSVLIAFELFMHILSSNDLFMNILSSGIAVAIMRVLMIIYFLSRDSIFRGQSLGKRLMGLKVISLKTKDPIKIQESFIRNVTLVIPYLVFIEVIYAGFSRTPIRMGDYFAKTFVIETR